MSTRAFRVSYKSRGLVIEGRAMLAENFLGCPAGAIRAALGSLASIERLDDDVLWDSETVGHCGGCGGPHDFDTSVPSVVWNEVIRAQGGSEYLCTSCIVRAFAKAGRSFTATLYGAGLDFAKIEVRIGGQVADDAYKIQEENNALRWKLTEASEREKAAVYCATHHCDCDQANKVRARSKDQIAPLHDGPGGPAGGPGTVGWMGGEQER